MSTCVKDGQEISFVKSPPSEIQLQCSICLELLDNPCILNCDCGTSFCAQCVGSLKNPSNVCPLCKGKFSIKMPNKQLNRTIKGLRIHCPHTSLGCSWIGELGTLSEHLNKSPKASNRLDGCGFESICCNFCTLPIPRNQITQHESDLCPRKPFSCEYCGHKSVLDDITTNHWPVCKKYPIPCPLNCGDTVPRESLLQHTNEACGALKVNCEYKFTGCGAIFERRKLQEHLQSNTVEHMSLLASYQKSEVQKLRTENFVLKSQLLSISVDLNAVKDEVKSLKAEKCEMKKKINSLEQKILETNSFKETKGATPLAEPSNWGSWKAVSPASVCWRVPESTNSSESVTLIMENYRRLKRHNNQWNSTPFYSPKGHKMNLRVAPNGRDSGKGTHLSVYAYIMQGEYDRSVCWPYTGVIRFSIVNGRNVHSDYLSFNVSPARRRSETEWPDGVGIEDVMSHKRVERDFVSDDSLTFIVDGVTFDPWI